MPTRHLILCSKAAYGRQQNLPQCKYNNQHVFGVSCTGMRFHGSTSCRVCHPQSGSAHGGSTLAIVTLFQRPPAAAVAVRGLRRVGRAGIACALVPSRAQAQVVTHADVVTDLAVATTALKPPWAAHLTGTQVKIGTSHH